MMFINVDYHEAVYHVLVFLYCIDYFCLVLYCRHIYKKKNIYIPLLKILNSKLKHVIK